MPRIICGCWSSPSRTMRSSCSTRPAMCVTWNGGARRLKGYAGGRDRRTPLLGVLSARAGGRGACRSGSWRRRALTGATRRRAGASARTARGSGPTWSSPRCATSAARSWGSGRSRATSRAASSPPSSCARRPPSFAAANAELEQFRLLVTSVRDYAIFLLDVSGRIRTWNAGAENIKGYTAEEVIGRHFELFYTEEARARQHPAYELEVASREGRFEEEGWRVRKDGTLFWANVVITALRDARGGAGRLRQGHARPDRAPPGAAAAGGIRAPRARRRPSGSGAAARRWSGSSRAIVAAARPGRDPADRDRRGDRPHRRRPSACSSRSFTGTGIVRSDDISGDPSARTRGRHFCGRRHAPVRSYLALPITLADGEVAGGLFFGHPDAGGVRRRGRGGRVEHRVHGGGRDRQRPAAGVRPSRDGRPRGGAAPARSGRRRAAAEPAAARPAARSRASSWARSTTPEPSWSAATSTTSSRSARARGASCLGDVCGSGPEAASQTALTRHTVRTAAMFDTDPATVIHTLNRALLRSNTDRFTTAVVPAPEQRPDRGEVAITVASGGHPPALIHRPDGTFEESAATGPAARRDGFRRSRTCRSRDHRLRPGDMLVLYTDGLTEARRAGVLFGVEGVKATLTRLRGAPPAQLANALVDAALDHAAAPVERRRRDRHPPGARTAGSGPGRDQRGARSHAGLAGALEQPLRSALGSAVSPPRPPGASRCR